MKYAWIAQHRESFPISLMCNSLGVSTSGCYDAVDRPLSSPRAQRWDNPRRGARGIYGSYKIARELARRDDVESACRTLPAGDGALSRRVSKTFTPTTTQSDLTKQAMPNTLARDFTTEKPNQKWVTDIANLPTLAGWVYVTVVLDLFSRKVVGGSIGDSLSTPALIA